ncbi:MAG: Rrf2 family transcriptional regulator [Rhodothermaceae bacterium]|nr:Rrf2 family transcriptional regulator [Rhodothermaceae bacterium]
MVLSKACTYGVLASLYVAKQSENKSYVSIRDMSNELRISFHFLTKILQKLTAEGILQSHKGPKGGILLAREARNITILDVVLAIDGDKVFTECVLGLPGCGSERPCPMHNHWITVREDLREMFSTKTLAATSDDIRELGLRLSIE